MGDISENEEHKSIVRMSTGVKVSIAALILGTLAGFWAVVSFVDDQRQREFRELNIRLGIVADSRHAAVSQWVEGQYSGLVSLSKNSSVQFYAMDVLEVSQQADGGAVDEELAAEAQYLFNLLTVTAEREGFLSPLEGINVQANLSSGGETGIALLNPQGETLVASQGMVGTNQWMQSAIAELTPARRGFIDFRLSVSGRPIIGFAVPVFSVQGDNAASDQVATLVGFRFVEDALYPLLIQPGATEKTAEGVLVRESEGGIEYLSPLANDPALMKLILSDDGNLAAGFAVSNPGGFSVKTDYRNHEALVVSRKVAGTPWTLMYKVDREEAMADTDGRLQKFLTFGIIVVFLLISIIVAAWRFGASIRAEKAMDEYRRSSTLFENILRFMRVLADAQPAEMFAVDKDGIYTFANRASANFAGTIPQDMKGKSMTSIIGPVRAIAFDEVNQQVIDGAGKIDRIYHFDSPDGTQVCKVNHIPLKGDAVYPPGVLVVVDDITDHMRIHETRQKGMRRLAQALVVLLDLKDPYATVHSAIVARLATAVAKDLGLSEDECNTVDLAANLVNLGKAVVPAAVLLKPAELSGDERQVLDDGLLMASELVHNVDFGLPVVETLAQVRENWDGSGPLGLKGDDIMLTSRVIACSNALVGLMSARAHRDAKSYEDAVQDLEREAVDHFGHSAVSAVTNFVENKGGMELIKLIALSDGQKLSAAELIDLIDKLSDGDIVLA